MNRFILPILLCFYLLPSPIYSQLSPEESLKSFKIADGLKVELFASEPMFANPTCMDIDHRGRVWVCEAVNYRRKLRGQPPLRAEGDRILVLEDSDGDGKADRCHVFYQSPEIMAPLGIAVAPHANGKGSTIYICQSPNIWVFEDKDGDLKADGPPKVLLTGFRGIDHDHGVHGINIGPDNRLYFTVGDEGVRQLKSANGQGPIWNSNSTTCRAGTIWRCDLQGNHLELIAHNFRNNYEACVNAFGDIFLSDNDDDGNQQTRICFVIPGGNYGYHPRGPGQSHWHEEQPGIVQKALRTYFGSPTGICFYEGDLLPKEYRNQLLHTDAGPREVRSFQLIPQGGGFQLEKKIILTSSDNWFRPSDIAVAPDGSVMVADWYDPGVGGHGMGDWKRGRIYRLIPSNHQGYKIPNPPIDQVNGFRTNLNSPCLASRAWARAYVASIPPEKQKELLSLNNRQGLSERSEALILWQQLNLGLLNNKELENEFNRHLGDQQPNMQVLLIRLLAEKAPDQLKAMVKTHLRSEEWKKLTLPAKRELLIALRNYSAEEVKDSILFLAQSYQLGDLFYRAALYIACGDSPARRDAVLADFTTIFPGWNDRIADLVWELRPSSVIHRLDQLLEKTDIPPSQKDRIIDIVSSSTDVAAGMMLLKLLKTDLREPTRERIIQNFRLFLPTKWKSLSQDKAFTKLLQEMIESKNPSSQIASLQLMAISKPQNAVKITISICSRSDNFDIQKEATRTLAELPGSESLDYLNQLVRTSPRLRPFAIQAIGVMANSQRGRSIEAKAALEVLKSIFLDPNKSTDFQRPVLQALAGSRNGSQWLIDLQNKQAINKELVGDARQLLRNSPFIDLRNKANLAFPLPGKLKKDQLPTIATLAKRQGNANKGRELMQASLRSDSQCLKCHMIRGIGGRVGPDLSMIGLKGSKENLFESILYPSKAIADQYLQHRIDTSSGQSLIGLIIQDTDQNVLLRDANGKDFSIPKSEIESRRKIDTSIMPDNLVQAFSEDDLIDLVEYLATLKKPVLTPEAWQIVGPFPNNGIQEPFPPEKQSPLRFDSEYTGKNNKKIKWSIIKNSDGGYFDLQQYYQGNSNEITSYLFREIESPIDQKAEFLVGNDDEIKIWLNGKMILLNTDHFAAVPARLHITVPLKKGKNTILMKLNNGNNPHGFYFSIESQQELKLLPLR